MIASQQKRPGVEFCLGVARAFNLPPEEVLREAGILPPEPPQTAMTKQALLYFSQLTEEQQRVVLTQLRALAELEVNARE